MCIDGLVGEGVGGGLGWWVEGQWVNVNHMSLDKGIKCLQKEIRNKKS